MKRAALYARVSTPDQHVETQLYDLCLAKTLTDFEMNNIAATPPPAFCYNSDHVQRVFALVRSALPPLS